MEKRTIKMSKKCFLHIGFPKTASTSLQVTCHKNAKLLQELGICYPIFKTNINTANLAKNYHNHSLPIQVMFQDEKKNSKRESITFYDIRSNLKEVKLSLMDQLEKHLEGSSNIFISGENICNMDEPEMNTMLDKILEYNYDIKAIILVRNPYSATCSSIQEKIKSGKYIDLISLNDNIPASYSNKAWNKLKTINRLKTIFGSKIMIKSFEQACSNPYGPVGFIIEELLNQDPSAFTYMKRNESMSNLSVRIQNELNKVNPQFSNGKKNKDFQKIPIEVDKSFNFTGKFLLTEAEFNILKNFIKDQEDGIESITGIKYDVPNRKFSEPIY